jgi:hypothetical protein
MRLLILLQGLLIFYSCKFDPEKDREYWHNLRVHIAKHESLKIVEDLNKYKDKNGQFPVYCGPYFYKFIKEYSVPA